MPGQVYTEVAKRKLSRAEILLQFVFRFSFMLDGTDKRASVYDWYIKLLHICNKQRQS